MHPEVLEASDSRKCPHCGMSLVSLSSERAAAAHDQKMTEDHAVKGKPHMDHHPRHGGLFGMDGDHHLELVVKKDGRIEVYVYDAWTDPLNVSKGRANVLLEIPGRSRQLLVPLKPLASGTAFSGRSEAAPRAVSATIKVTLDKELLSMTFPLQKPSRRAASVRVAGTSSTRKTAPPPE
jgi:hypothetical protein